MRDAVAAAGWSHSLGERLKKAQAERAQLESEIHHAPAPPAADMIPRLVEHIANA